MDRNRIGSGFCGFTALLAVTLLLVASNRATAQRSNRLSYNPMTGQSEPDPRRAPAETHRDLTLDDEALDDELVLEDEILDDEEPYVELAGHAEDCDCGACRPIEPACGLADTLCSEQVRRTSCAPRAHFYVGFEAVYVKPRFESNVAFTRMDSDAAGSFFTFSDTEFDYDLELNPRVFLGWQHGNGIGVRLTWWQFDHAAATASGNPPASGFGSITSPTIGNFNIVSTVPSDSFSASTGLEAYAIELEATKQTSFCSWDLGIGCGIRYAYTQQSYFAQLRNTNNALRDQINYQHSLEGFGPTISLDVYRPFGCRSGIFCKARGSVLFGDGESNLTAGTNLDLSTPSTTTRTTGRDDLLSIGEVQVGYRWQGRRKQGKLLRPFCSIAMEGQIWNGAGTASSEEGTLGFFGFNTGIGVDW